jgi:HPt (histidine-containing phosphotransfer) domain-containing protein
MNHPMSSYEAHALHAKALELAGDDHTIAARLLEMIVDTNRSTLASLQDRIGASSWGEVASAAHRIAGSARLLGCGALIALLTELEAAARECEPERVGKLAPLVADALAKLELAIDAAVVGEVVPH